MYGNNNLMTSGLVGPSYGNPSILENTAPQYLPASETTTQYPLYNPSATSNVSQYGPTISGMDTQQSSYVSGQPVTQYIQTIQPEAQYVQAGQPAPQYVQAGQPVPQYVQAGQPVTQYVQTGQSGSQYLQAGQPGTQYVETGLPGTEYIQTIPNTGTVDPTGNYVSYNAPTNATDPTYGTAVLTDPQYATYTTVPTSLQQEYGLGGTNVVTKEYDYKYDVTQKDTGGTLSRVLQQPSEISRSHYPDESRYSSSHGRSESAVRKNNSKGVNNSNQRQNQRLNELRQSEFNTVVSGSDDEDKIQSRKKGGEPMDADGPGMGKPPRRKISKGAHQRYDDGRQPQFINGSNIVYKTGGKAADNSKERRRVEQPMDYEDSTPMDSLDSRIVGLKHDRKESIDRLKRMQQRERTGDVDTRSRDLQQRDRTIARMKQVTNYEASESDITDVTDTERSHVAVRRGSQLPPHLVLKYQDYYKIDRTDDEFQDPASYHKAKRASRANILSKAEMMLESRRRSRIHDINSSDDEGQQRVRQNELNKIFRLTARTSPESEYMENKSRSSRALTSPEVERSRYRKSKSKYPRRKKLQPIRNRRQRAPTFVVARPKVRHIFIYNILWLRYVVYKEGRKEMFYLTTHSTHFIYGYMASDIW